MDKKWIKRIKKNKATIALSKYLIFLIKQINEKDIHDEILKRNLGYDEILIEESSKDILELNPRKKRKRKRLRLLHLLRLQPPHRHRLLHRLLNRSLP